MNIYCSNKLKGLLPESLIQDKSDCLVSFLGDWNGHIFSFKRIRYLVLLNNITYYCLLFPNIKKADFKEIDTIFVDRLMKQFLFDRVLLEEDFIGIAEKVLPITFTSTNNNKPLIGTLNDYILQIKALLDMRNMNLHSIFYINNIINSSLPRAGGNNLRKYGRPISDMRELYKTCP